MVADEVLKRDEERRRRRDEGEEDEEMPQERTPAEVATNDRSRNHPDQEVKPKVVAKTRLRFTDSEVAEMRSMGINPQIKILGFQSSDLLQIDENIKHSYFIYPDENTYTGSTRTFAALLQSCTKLKKHALAICRFKRNNTPEFAVLIPQPEEMSEDGKSQEVPPGFHVIILPYKDDLRAQPRSITGTEEIGKSS
jgi:ATP-dependent DNA helicase 2 subunit 1